MYLFESTLVTNISLIDNPFPFSYALYTCPGTRHGEVPLPSEGADEQDSADLREPGPEVRVLPGPASRWPLLLSQCDGGSCHVTPVSARESACSFSKFPSPARDHLQGFTMQSNCMPAPPFIGSLVMVHKFMSEDHAFYTVIHTMFEIVTVCVCVFTTVSWVEGS